MNKRVFIAAGYNTISLGTGRREFNPKKERPGLSYYIQEAGRGSLDQVKNPDAINEAVIGNFMAARFNKQGNLPAFIPSIHESLKGKPSVAVEGACASGGLALMTAIKTVLSGCANSVLTIGVEVQNSVKAIYGADILAGAGFYEKRSEGHAYYFPGCFSDRAGEYFKKYGREQTREAFAQWYVNAIENARTCPTAQEYHNTKKNLFEVALREPNPDYFVDNLNVYDCSKVSDGASSVIITNEDGLRELGLNIDDAIEIIGFGQATDNIIDKPSDPLELSTAKISISKALQMAGINKNEIRTFEVHDCFTIAGILMVEALGLADKGHGKDYVLTKETSREGFTPINTTGGLIGWGHPTGATGVHQAVTLWEQLLGKAGESQIELDYKRPYGMSVNMGGDDRTVVSIVYKSTL